MTNYNYILIFIIVILIIVLVYKRNKRNKNNENFAAQTQESNFVALVDEIIKLSDLATIKEKFNVNVVVIKNYVETLNKDLNKTINDKLTEGTKITKPDDVISKNKIFLDFLNKHKITNEDVELLKLIQLRIENHFNQDKCVFNKHKDDSNDAIPPSNLQNLKYCSVSNIAVKRALDIFHKSYNGVVAEIDNFIQRNDDYLVIKTSLIDNNEKLKNIIVQLKKIKVENLYGSGILKKGETNIDNKKIDIVADKKTIKDEIDKLKESNKTNNVIVNRLTKVFEALTSIYDNLNLVLTYDSKKPYNFDDGINIKYILLKQKKTAEAKEDYIVKLEGIKDNEITRNNQTKFKANLDHHDMLFEKIFSKEEELFNLKNIVIGETKLLKNTDGSVKKDANGKLEKIIHLCADTEIRDLTIFKTNLNNLLKDITDQNTKKTIIDKILVLIDMYINIYKGIKKYLNDKKALYMQKTQRCINCNLFVDVDKDNVVKNKCICYRNEDSKIKQSNSQNVLRDKLLNDSSDKIQDELVKLENVKMKIDIEYLVFNKLRNSLVKNK